MGYLRGALDKLSSLFWLWDFRRAQGTRPAGRYKKNSPSVPKTPAVLAVKQTNGMRIAKPPASKLKSKSKFSARAFKELEKAKKTFEKAKEASKKAKQILEAIPLQAYNTRTTTPYKKIATCRSKARTVLAVRQTNGMKVAKLPARKSRQKPSERAVEEACKVVLFGNGLVIMEKTPSPLVDIARDNAAQSPLLRLPPEIRVKIWKYAIPGNIVRICKMGRNTPIDLKPWKETCLDFKGHAVGLVGNDNPVKWLNVLLEEKPRAATAYRLPEVSRQIYAETAVRAYLGDFFFFDSLRGELKCDSMKVWADSLIPAHRDVIAEIAITDFSIEMYLTWHCQMRFRECFPGLKRIHVKEEDMNICRIYCQHQGFGKETKTAH